MWLDMKHAELESTSKNAPVPTVGKIYKMWYLPNLEQNLATNKVAKNTYRSYTSSYNQNVAPTWENVPITEIKGLMVQEWLNTMQKESARIAKIVLRSIIDLAMTFDIVDHNVLRRQYVMPSDGLERNKEIYTYDEVINLLTKIRGQLFESAFIVAAMGGARVGESLAVATEDLTTIDINNQKFVIVSINKQLHQNDNTIDDRMKTAQSERKTLVPWNYGGQRLMEIANSASTRWLSDDTTGKPISQNKLTRLWKAFVKENYIPPRNLRKTWRTYAQYTWDVDYDTLELLMGHKLQGVTGTHYLQPTIEDLAKKFAEALNRFESS